MQMAHFELSKPIFGDIELLDLDLRVGDTSRAHVSIWKISQTILCIWVSTCFHLEDISNNSMHMGPGHVKLIKILMIFFLNVIYMPLNYIVKKRYYDMLTLKMQIWHVEMKHKLHGTFILKSLFIDYFL